MKLMWVFVIASTARTETINSENLQNCKTEASDYDPFLFGIRCSNISSISTIRELVDKNRNLYNYYRGSLRVLDSTIPAVPEKSFSFNTELKQLNLMGIHIKTISSFAFEGLEKLEELHLDKNELTGLTKDVFPGLHSLKKLFLQHNYITMIDRSIFKDLAKLSYLNISHNSLENLKIGTFSGLTSLEILDISNNKLLELSEHNFVSLSKLEILHFENNPLPNEANAPHDMDFPRLLIRLVIDLPRLKLISFKNNHEQLWACNELNEIFRECNLKNIVIPTGESFENDNIGGIACHY